jgi:flagellar FliJ protein
MAFRFALAPVLKLRESLEELLLHRLEQTQHEISYAAQLLDGLRAESHVLAVSREQGLAAGLAGADLHFREQLRQGLRMQERTLEQKLAELQRRRAQQLADYEEARNKRRVLADLRDRQREAHETKLAHRQQRAADDIFLARRGRG